MNKELLISLTKDWKMGALRLVTKQLKCEKTALLSPQFYCCNSKQPHAS